MNAEQAAGEFRIRHADLCDAEVRLHDERFRAATGVGPRDRVLDIGCGTGQSTREAARAAGAGTVLGVDLSAGLLELARRLTDREGLRNVSYLQADAQVHRFPPRHFDLCISRFGAMFFADPVAAFINIGSALRPGGRLVLMVWQAGDRNEWWSEIEQSIARDEAVTAASADGPGMFSLADPTTTTSILTAAGFGDVSFTDVNEPVYYGPDTATAYDFVTGFQQIKNLLAALDPAPAEDARQRVRAIIAEHETAGGVFFGSRVWIITARR